jgi:hypothetical protein
VSSKYPKYRVVVVVEDRAVVAGKLVSHMKNTATSDLRLSVILGQQPRSVVSKVESH